MIGKLIFKLPEEREDFELAQNAWKYKAMIDDIENKLRSWSKYEDMDTVTVDELRKIINDLREQYFDE